jgi:hypothetical protein
MNMYRTVLYTKNTQVAEAKDKARELLNRAKEEADGAARPLKQCTLHQASPQPVLVLLFPRRDNE